MVYANKFQLCYAENKVVFYKRSMLPISGFYGWLTFNLADPIFFLMMLRYGIFLKTVQEQGLIYLVFVKNFINCRLRLKLANGSALVLAHSCTFESFFLLSFTLNQFKDSFKPCKYILLIGFKNIGQETEIKRI